MEDGKEINSERMLVHFWRNGVKYLIGKVWDWWCFFFVFFFFNFYADF